MLDINFIRENLVVCRQAAVNKNRQVNWDRLLALDDKRRELVGQIDEVRAQRNQTAALRTEASAKHGKELKSKLKSLEEQQREIQGEYDTLMLSVPNVPDISVPVGKDESGNVEIKKWGTPAKFDFPVRDHIELASRLDLVDFERGVKVGGFRAYFLKNEAALLEFAVLFYTFRKLISKGYTPLIAPSLTKEFTFTGVGQLPWGRDEIYHLEKDDLYISGTAEVPVTSYFSNEVLAEKDLPKKFVAYSPCFRREAGSYGKDTKGIYRIHQFNKVEQVVITSADTEKSLQIHQELLNNAEEVLQDLKLPYRVLMMCTGDMGEPQVKKYDIETWMPGRNGYGETMSDSFMGDFQTRRLKIRYKTKEGKTLYCHSLNNTALASPRILIPILENYQQEDGSVIVPEVLQPLVGVEVIRSKISS